MKINRLKDCSQIVRCFSNRICLSILLLFGLILLPIVLYAEEKSEVSFTPSSIRVHHQALVDISSKEGGFDSGIRLNQAGEEASEYLFRGYRQAGLEKVRKEVFYPNRWWPEHYDLTILDKSNQPSLRLNTFPLWYCEGAKELDLEVVYAGFGTKGEFRGLNVKGKAVLIDMKRLLHFIQSYNVTKALETARERGAKAIIIAETRIDSPTGNRVGEGGMIKDQKGQTPELFPMPVFSIGKNDGIILKSRLKEGSTRVRINLGYSLRPGRAANIVGELAGNGKTDETIVVGGHYDTWFTGAIDNLGSQASLIELAGYFASIPQTQRDRNLIFVSLFGHEFGNEFMGHAAFIEKHADLQGKVTCFFNIDGSGSWGWEENPETGEIYPTNSDDKGGTLASSWELASLTHQPIYKYARGSWVNFPNNFFVADIRGPIAKAGFPVLLVISKHIYYHSLFDTIDRITPDQVYRRTLMNRDIITSMMKTPAGHLINVDTNPNRRNKLEKGDAESMQFPPNPSPWLDKAPTDLSMHLLPAKAQVFSPVIGWVGYWKGSEIMGPTNVIWDFGGLLGLLGPKNDFFSGTMYFFPGIKSISLTVSDAMGRTSSISRDIEIEAGQYIYLYWLLAALALILMIFVFRRIFRRSKK